MVTLVVSTIIVMASFIVADGYLSPARGEEAIRVEREKDRTVYAIGSQEDKDGLSDRERSWEMLTNMTVIHKQDDTRDQNGKRPDHNR